MDLHVGFLCWSILAFTGSGLTLDCCCEKLANGSYSFHLDEPPGNFCTVNWSLNNTVLVDEYGESDSNIVLHWEKMKLILKKDEEQNYARWLKYKKDCPDMGVSLDAACTDSCKAPTAAPGGTTGPPTTTTTTSSPLPNWAIIIIIIIIGSIVIVAIIAIVIFVKRPPACLNRRWTAVPPTGTPGTPV